MSDNDIFPLIIGIIFSILFWSGVIFVIFKLFKKLFGHSTLAVNTSVSLPPPVTTKDDPIPFGYKMGWLAIKSADANLIINMLNLKDVRVTNWETGLSTVYELNNAVFITPSLNGWVLVVGWQFATMSDSPKKVEVLLLKLSKKFKEAQLFGTHRVVEAHCWFKAIEGKMVRAFSYVGEAGEITLDQGSLTKIEKEIIEQQKKKGSFPFFTENDIMKVAASWSIDPSKISKKTSAKGNCYLGIYSTS